MIRDGHKYIKKYCVTNDKYLLVIYEKIKGKMYLKRIQVIFYSKNTKIYSLQTGIITF